ncbi:hypothetical protein L596_013474 [Steinernema carpocapsae]|uniref:Autophagy-related protein n=1 Tax=Steinernema carpocapsae TaxID=34508 RepID=A0A4U5P0B6_STECR|nr:hypothetical protein L596_013474 [Steinernema carpocapsae]
MSSPASSTTVAEKKPYKERYSLEKRQAKARNVLHGHSVHVPVVCEKASGSRLEHLKQDCYKVASNITIGTFLVIIRERLSLTEDEAIFLFAKNAIMSTTKTMAEVYDEFKDEEDGFLYLTYQEESVYGQ